jgi:hypothetical protein
MSCLTTLQYISAVEVMMHKDGVQAIRFFSQLFVSLFLHCSFVAVIATDTLLSGLKFHNVPVFGRRCFRDMLMLRPLAKLLRRMRRKRPNGSEGREQVFKRDKS